MKALYVVIGIIVGLVIGIFVPKPVPHTEHDAHQMSMEQMMHSMNANLEGKSGDAFDEAFLKEMIVHHQGAVSMAELALTNAKHMELRELAQAIITAQEEEIAQMKSWQQTWYGR
jgi:uncharacterized protein (DUF305 family)